MKKDVETQLANYKDWYKLEEWIMQEPARITGCTEMKEWTLSQYLHLWEVALKKKPSLIFYLEDIHESLWKVALDTELGNALTPERLDQYKWDNKFQIFRMAIKVAPDLMIKFQKNLDTLWEISAKNYPIVKSFAPSSIIAALRKELEEAREEIKKIKKSDILSKVHIHKDKYWEILRTLPFDIIIKINYKSAEEGFYAVLKYNFISCEPLYGLLHVLNNSLPQEKKGDNYITQRYLAENIEWYKEYDNTWSPIEQLISRVEEIIKKSKRDKDKKEALSILLDDIKQLKIAEELIE